MTVYVDRMNKQVLGLRFTAHMIADSREELDAMASQIGLKPAWRQASGQWHEHYDLTETKRQRAVEAGAVEVTSKELTKIALRHGWRRGIEVQS